MSISAQEREICLRVLQEISEDPSVINEDERMKALIAKIHTRGKKGQRTAIRAARVEADRARQAATQMVRQQKQGLNLPAALSAPAQDEAQGQSKNLLECPSLCYICKHPYQELHWFYHSLCPDCAAMNWEKRGQRADLQGRVALLTGGRIKIGYHVALRLLRDGATVLLTTRFPGDAVRRLSREEDFHEWRGRLQVFGLDLRDLPSVEAFAGQLLETQPHLDIIIHNAAQTVKRPLAFYQHLLDEENLKALPAGTESLIAGTLNRHAASANGVALLEQHPRYPGEMAMEEYFPRGYLDADGQQVDTRPENSWRQRLHEVSTVEMLEVNLVNAVAPFVLNARLKPLLLRAPQARRFIINVSAMEGQFARKSKTWFHPHTNMAKAALNMMTRTSAADLACDGIYMNSVDTGWITDENPYQRAANIREKHEFYTPLDIVDGAARIYDPIAQGVSQPQEPLHGHFLKDYAPYPW